MVPPMKNFGGNEKFGVLYFISPHISRRDIDSVNIPKLSIS
jgi:hypothetical protein